MLERYASEGTPRVDEARKERPDERRIASFIGANAAAGPRPVDVRPPAAKATPAPVPAAREAEPAPEPAETTVESEPLIDVRQLVDYVGFVARSVLRHKLLASGTVALVIALTVTAVALLPRSYHVQTKLLAQRNAVMAALSNPGRAVPWDADAPTRAAAETVLRRDNLIALITQTDLIRDWERTRAPILRFKDWVITKIARHEPTPDEKLDALVGLLETRMIVEAGPVGDGTVTIDLDWPNAEMAYRLVQAAQQAFLEARQVAETAAIGESIAILQRYTEQLHEKINLTLAELDQKPGKAATVAGVTRPRTTAAIRTRAAAALSTLATQMGAPELDPSLETDPDRGRLKTTLTEKRRELARIEDQRSTQITTERAKLSQMLTVYTPQHPSVISQQQTIAALERDSPQALALAAEVEELQADYDKREADAADLQVKALAKRRAAAAATSVAAAAPAAVDDEPAPAPAPRTTLAEGTEFAGLRLRSELNQLESVLERTDGARIELAVSQAAFKYRYTVVRPAQVPRDPTFPNTRLMFAAGVVASLVLALGVVVAKDLLSNRILEPWQIERGLGLPVLGTLRTA